MYDRPTPITTETEWLMSTDTSPLDLTTAHNTAVKDAIERATPEDRDLLEAVFYERKSYRQLGVRLGISHVHAWRLVQAALERLREDLLADPSITERYDLGSTDNVE